MNSTSSSEWDCTGPFFSTAVPNIIENPFCHTARHPLIYYARIQEPFQQRNRLNVKENSNCFMKAFQWYTQERGSGHTDENSSKVNNSDFAAWLDKKYGEYLKKNQQTGSQLVLKQSSTLKGDKMSKKQKPTRKFGRMRSPWKKRRNTSKEKGDVICLDQSIEFILQPKDLPKPASECCQRCRNSRIQSSTTIISKESPKDTKFTAKSKSLLSIYRARGVCENTEVKTKSHAKNICECLKSYKGTQYETLSIESLTTSRNYNTKPQGLEENKMCDVKTTRYSPRTLSRSNILCQCSELNAYKVGTPLQKHTTQKDDQSNEEYESKPKNQEYSSKMLKTAVKIPENHVNVTKSENCSAQTSDYPINFGSVMYARRQPLLVKVLYVNK